MNSHIKQQWLNALRSNEYSQGTGHLQTPDGFCCLGVLCDIYAKETGTPWETTSDGRFSYIKGESNYLPEEVKEWAGLDRCSPLVKTSHLGDGITGLAFLNDNGIEFSEIAQIIEEQY